MCTIIIISLPYYDVNIFRCFYIATIKAHGTMLPFTLPLEDDGFAYNVYKLLFGSWFNLQIGTMYIHHEMCIVDGDVYETIMVHKNMSEMVQTKKHGSHAPTYIKV